MNRVVLPKSRQYRIGLGWRSASGGELAPPFAHHHAR